MTTFLKNFAVWQRSVRRQAELIREKGGMSSEPHELAEAVFTAASVIRRAFRDARQHRTGSSSAGADITKVVDALRSIAEEAINVGSPLEAYENDIEVGSVTFQTLCEDVVEGADLTISKVPVGTAYGFIVTPSRFPYRGYYVHWKEFENSLASFCLLDPHAEPDAEVIERFDKIEHGKLDFPVPPHAEKENLFTKVMNEDSSEEYEPDEDRELDNRSDVNTQAGGMGESSNAEQLAGEHIGSKSDRFIPQWLGKVFLEAMASQAGELKLPRELRAIWYALSSGEVIDLRNRLLDATLIDFEPGDIQDAEYVISRHTKRENALLFTCLYLCALLIDEFPPVKGLIEHLRKASTSSHRWKIRPDHTPGAIGELELLISVVVESLEIGMWRGNPNLRKSFRPLYSLSFASLVQDEILSIDRGAQDEIRKRLAEVFDFCRGGEGASAKGFPDSAYLRGPGLRRNKPVLEYPSGSATKKRPPVAAKPTEKVSVPASTPKKDFSEPSRYMPNWTGSSFLKKLRVDKLPKVLPREISQIFTCLREAASDPAVLQIRSCDFGSLEMDQLIAVGRVLGNLGDGDHTLIFSTLYLVSLLMEKYEISNDEILQLYRSGNASLRFVDRSFIWSARKEMEVLISLVAVSFELGMWNEDKAASDTRQQWDLPFPSNFTTRDMQADPTGRATIAMLLEKAKNRLAVRSKREQVDMRRKNSAVQITDASEIVGSNVEAKIALNLPTAASKSKRSLAQKFLYVMTGYKEE